MSTDRRADSELSPQPTSPEPGVLTPEKLRDLLAEGRALRGPLEQRLAAMQTVPQENLVARAR
jgi:hypothetical protein